MKYWYIHCDNVYEFNDAPGELFSSEDAAWKAIRDRKQARIMELKAELEILERDD